MIFRYVDDFGDCQGVVASTLVDCQIAKVLLSFELDVVLDDQSETRCRDTEGLGAIQARIDTGDGILLEQILADLSS